ncbi:hypothetical protein K438DRAFT_1748339 [Mycena galopus ATCC 62051]|nr:hypothetical protein K438DRAFT_1748339 [Mycena galopus ATCC 62051]
MSLYSLHKTLAPAYPVKVPPINAVLFFDEGTRLASGGDDGVVRIWDVRSGDCQQELTDSLNRSGQITCLSLMKDSTGQAQFAKQGHLTPVFRLDEVVEAQAVDPIKAQFAVSSFKGQIKMYRVENRNSNIPRSLLFLGDSNEHLAIHNLKPGPVLYLDRASGLPVSHCLDHCGDLGGGVGSVALSPNRRMKAIHNILADRFDLYGSGAPNPIGLRVSSSSGRLKGAAFGEEGQMLVCGGDDGFIHIFDGVQAVEQETLTLSSDCSTVYAVATCTTQEYHLIAAGGSASPATIYIWRKSTQFKQAKDRGDAIEREAIAARVREKAKKLAKADAKAKLAREEKAVREAEVEELTRRVHLSKTEVGGTAFVIIIGLVFCVQGIVQPGSPANIDWCPHFPTASCYMTANVTKPLQSDMEKEHEKKLADEVQQSPLPWRLHATYNIPHCTCQTCVKYLAHLSQTWDGRSGEQSDDEDSSSERSDPSDDVDQWQPPDEDAPEDENEGGTHMRNIYVLQSANGRLQTNHLFQTDPAIFGRAQEGIANLMTQIFEIEKEDEEVQAEVHSLEQQLHGAQALIQELEEKVSRLDSTSRHKRTAREGAGGTPVHLITGVDQLHLDVRPTEAMDTDTGIGVGTETAQSSLSDVRRKLADLYTEFKGKKVPAPNESPEYLARWIQAHKSPLTGVPACAPDWAVNLRDARGRQVLMTLAPSGNGRRSKASRRQHRIGFLAILRLLLRPGAYASIIERISVPIADVPLSKVHFSELELEEPNEDKLARILAAKGLTVATADDCWQYCLKFAEEKLKSGGGGYDTSVLEDLITQARARVAEDEPPLFYPLNLWKCIYNHTTNKNSPLESIDMVLIHTNARIAGRKLPPTGRRHRKHPRGNALLLGLAEAVVCVAGSGRWLAQGSGCSRTASNWMSEWIDLEDSKTTYRAQEKSRLRASCALNSSRSTEICPTGSSPNPATVEAKSEGQGVPEDWIEEYCLENDFNERRAERGTGSSLGWKALVGRNQRNRLSDIVWQTKGGRLDCRARPDSVRSTRSGPIRSSQNPGSEVANSRSQRRRRTTYRTRSKSVRAPTRVGAPTLSQDELIAGQEHRKWSEGAYRRDKIKSEHRKWSGGDLPGKNKSKARVPLAWRTS